ncbi:MAG TPA: 5-(carboxyamino)imidazole ribonucleotide mutase [Thermoanaerobaculia bacterium]|nr:5-(carboxyamino)imidazole ribonucleotide mutase [Thermoanaerobaculia bacterium]
MTLTSPRIGIVMGSKSDWQVMKGAKEILDGFALEAEVRVLSAHRTPEAACAYARDAAGRGLAVLIAGAGGAAHLPGVLAAHTVLPVIGVPVPSGVLAGVDALLAIVQMPRGIPVATVGIGRADNAGLLAVALLALADRALYERLEAYRRDLVAAAEAADREIQGEL